MTVKSTQETKYIPSEIRKTKGKFKGRYESSKDKIDNLEYGTKKYAIQNFNNNANITLDALQQGLDLSQSDINILSKQYKKIKELGGSTEAADKKLNKIKMFYKSNENLKKKGKDPFVENQQFDT
jgi:hypothetical protein